MTTQAQIEANKQNAQLSAGAITTQGKEIVSKNAIKHGIFAKDVVITSGGENIEEYNQLFNNLIESLKPNGQLEYLLVEKIAIDHWRLKRLFKYERVSIKQASLFMHNDNEDKCSFTMSHPMEQDVIVKYERSLQKSILQNIAVLKKLQSSD